MRIDSFGIEFLSFTKSLLSWVVQDIDRQQNLKSWSYVIDIVTHVLILPSHFSTCHLIFDSAFIQLPLI